MLTDSPINSIYSKTEKNKFRKGFNKNRLHAKSNKMKMQIHEFVFVREKMLIHNYFHS